LSALRKSNEEARIRHADWLEKQKKSNEEARILHEQRMKELRQQNEKLAELESKLDIVLQSSDSTLTHPLPTDNN
jgi:hypothetical protein